MTDEAEALLRAAAFKAELAASRRLAERSGMNDTEALRATLAHSAGAAGLDQLLRERAARRLRSEQAQDARRALAAASLARRQAGPAAAPQWRAWFDGSARPNPGRCTLGAVLEGPGGVQVELSRALGYGNSSEAEYQALIAVLQAAVEHGAVAPAIQGDSQVVIDDVHAPESAAASSLQPYRAQARALLARLPGATLRWIPRHKNGRADALSQRAATIDTEEESHAGTED
ncbi:ribonuclease HI family protein [Massilia sp. G4R7]|uniref:Ribonuclease HI family protein n=1 Tax=Massilia phyllostachyos TaxID=2898585 RepID=A0ABS8Q3Y6_9BURK|nr:ribonuclease HI family protein [Massilia phyllostachyos]MCD2516452.1 ribonuclease HI family protein [Massilia phyllostachyos]